MNRSAWVIRRSALMVAALTLAGTVMAQEDEQARAAGVTARWRFVDEALEVELSAETEGWVLVGFNTPGRGLDGARLVFVAVDGVGDARAEEHRASPPNHAAVEDDGVSVIRARQAGGRTRATLRIPRRSRGGIELAPGAEVELILAWSVSDDFEHHSRRREHLTRQL